MKVSIMHLTTFLVVIFSLCVFVSPTPKVHYEDVDAWDMESDDDCVTPLRELGQCIPWTACTPLNRIARWDRVRPYTCGFSGKEPLVCCPQSSQVGEPTTTPPTTPAPGQPIKRDVSAYGIQPSFLPKECGKSNRMNTRFGTHPKYARPGDWPWMAIILKEQSNSTFVPNCGGALLSDRFVITAAHCLVTEKSSIMNPRMLRVQLGALDLREENEIGSLLVEVDNVLIHENFDPRTFKNDIAIMRFSRPVNFTERIQPVCLPYEFDFSPPELLEDRLAVLTGYGTLRLDGQPSSVLRDENTVILSQEMCRKTYENQINITMEYLCSGNIDESECKGDSGGPLVTLRSVSYYLTGILSYGNLCGQPNYPTVYTRVSMYLDWLSNNLARLQQYD